MDLRIWIYQTYEGISIEFKENEYSFLFFLERNYNSKKIIEFLKEIFSKVAYEIRSNGSSDTKYYFKL